MLSVQQNSVGEDPHQPRYGLRKHRQPVAVYDVSKGTRGRFFGYLGRITFFAVIALLVYVGAVRFLHRPHTADAASSVELVEDPPTVAPAPTVGPHLGYVATWGITSSDAAISWSTDSPATTALSYGTTRSLGQTIPVQKDMVTSHGVKLSGLASGTTYYFVAESAGQNGAISTSPVSTFTTLPMGNGPTISSITVVPGINHQVDISWTTSIPTFNYVQIGSSSTYDRWSTRTELTTHPKPSITWVPSGTVHYQLVSTDAKGNKTVSPDYTFVEP